MDDRVDRGGGNRVTNGILREATYGKRLDESNANRLSALTAIVVFAAYFWRLHLTVAFTGLGSALSGAGLSFGSAVAGFANVWPLALLFAGLGVVATGLVFAHQRRNRIGSGRLGLDVRDRPDWQARR